MAVVFTGTELRNEICRLYGYLLLLGQDLEHSLRNCLESAERAFNTKSTPIPYYGDPQEASFLDLIAMFGSLLDKSHPGSRQLVSSLHRARKLRNRLAHGFLADLEPQDISSDGAIGKLHDRLKAVESVFFPQIMVIRTIGRGYDAEYGLTDELIDQLIRKGREEQERIDREIESLLEPDSEEEA